MAEHSQWHGHRLSTLPQGQSWLTGGGRRPAPVSWESDPWPFDDLAELDALEAGDAPSTQPADIGGSRRGATLLALLAVAAIITIIVGRRSGPPDQPGALPDPASQVVTSLTRAHLTPVTVHVGDYIKFQLPDGRSYDTVLEQPGTPTPVVEALTLPGQVPQLRADSTGHAVVEVMSAPPCATEAGCPDQRVLLGGVQISVQP